MSLLVNLIGDRILENKSKPNVPLHELGLQTDESRPFENPSE